MSTCVYHLTFKTALHLGRASGPAQTGKLGLEKTETYIPADTLFSALCHTWATFYGTESLTQFLDPYTTESDTLPFMLTSAFPFAYDIHFYPNVNGLDKHASSLAETHDNSPQPAGGLGGVDPPSKKIKRIQFVSQNIFQDIISGNPPKFNEKNVITGEKIWISCEESKQLPTAKDDDFTVWTTQTRPRVTIGSQNAGSEIWHVQTVQFNQNCGLWFAARFDSDDTQQKIETLLRVLGDTGIGGERNAGYGLFDFKPKTVEMPTTEAGDQFITLSPISPKSPQQLEQLLTGEVAYHLNFVNKDGTATHRKQVNMFAEGSVLNTSNEQPIGRLVDLSPNGYAHPVYRYGYAWPVTIKGASTS